MPKPPPILCFAGRSGGGKTTLLVEVIRLLRARGYRVVSVKHDVHGADFDTRGKDSWRHKDAGAETAVLVAPGRVVSISDSAVGEPSLAEVRDRFGADADIVLAEGFKRAPHPKIEVARAEQGGALMLKAGEGLVAVASDFDVDVAVPRLDINAPGKVADFVEETFLKPRRGPRP